MMHACENSLADIAKRLEAVLPHTDFVLCLPEDNPAIEAAFSARLNGRRGLVIRGDEARQMLALYSLYAFSDKVIIGSLDEPYGRKLRNLLLSGVASEAELIEDVILGGM